MIRRFLHLVLLIGSLAASSAALPGDITVVVVRHAEKAEEPAGDPPLSAAGKQRARSLSAWLEDSRVSMIFASDTRRARDTARPAAERRGLPILEYPGKAIEQLLERVRQAPPGTTVLVVGHSNTVPIIIDRLTGGRERVTLRDDEFDAMFVVQWRPEGDSDLSRLRY